MSPPLPRPLPRFLGGKPQPQYRLLQQQPAQPAPAPAQKPQRRAAELGKAVLGVASTGLGVASVAFPPALPIAGITGAVQVIDNQLGNPVAFAVGTAIQAVGVAGEFAVDGVVAVANGIGDGVNAIGKGVGDLFDGIFGKKK
jgi:hypothetical protein